MPKPSWMTSTFSLISLIIVVGFVILCVWMKQLEPLREVALLILGSYGMKKGQEMGQKANGAPNAAPTPE